ncbi:hypothetical protein DICPUDRAFT_99751 [Dictyostelium purpureum]|uniref:RING-type domain-containing protein n=1 Tax=Dictyostelium purpureum TaxID=5786 RepID=F1A268_DICPU|nr:uncharacterized protein DICPUDRAFT_99751 [Dictyostelium purpureum]EGC29710.1 hypothetical protein DICPUDRAFT_99751 [Dictyostelium purpureum]|eukprot:XP_003293762.1 hypothetical protein DICPUDRAFT_99751 [Dictyostelium purpureum]
MIDSDQTPNSLTMLMMIKNGNPIYNKKDSDISDSSGDEDYRSSSKSLQKFFIDLSEDFTCSICYELFDKPIILPCSHNFCKLCIENMITGQKNNTSFSCPFCRGEVKLNEKGVDGLPINCHLLTAVEKLKNANAFCPKFCDSCSSKKITKKCETCSIFLCKTCDSIHSIKNPSHKTIYSDSHIASDFDIETHITKENESDPPVYLPFNISRSQCTQLFKNWLTSLWFAPSDLEFTRSVRYIKPIYIPYWIYEAHTTTKYSANISNGIPVTSILTSPTQQHNIYNHHPIGKFESANWSHKVNIVSNRYRHATIANTKLIDKDLLAQVQTWEVTNIPTVEQGPPNPKIQPLAFLMDESTAWKKIAEAKIRQKDKEVCENRIKVGCGVGGITKDIVIETTLTRVASQKVFLPVYFIKYIYDSKSYTVIVNAQNSKIVGHRPYSGLSSMLKIFGGTSK